MCYDSGCGGYAQLHSPRLTLLPPHQWWANELYPWKVKWCSWKTQCIPFQSQDYQALCLWSSAKFISWEWRGDLWNITLLLVIDDIDSNSRGNSSNSRGYRTFSFELCKRVVPSLQVVISCGCVGHTCGGCTSPWWDSGPGYPRNIRLGHMACFLIICICSSINLHDLQKIQYILCPFPHNFTFTVKYI